MNQRLQKNDVKSDIDITMSQDKWEVLMGNDILIRYVSKIDDNISKTTAEMKTVVTATLKGYFANDAREITDDIPFETSQHQRFSIGDGDTIPGIELALRQSRVGDEFFVFMSPRFAFGPKGRSAFKFECDINTNGPLDSVDPYFSISESSEVPSNAYVIYHVYVSDHWHPLQQEETPEKALNLLLFRKECGNRYFSWKYIDFAARSYSAGIKEGDSIYKSLASENNEGDKDEGLKKKIFDA